MHDAYALHILYIMIVLRAKIHHKSKLEAYKPMRSKLIKNDAFKKL